MSSRPLTSGSRSTAGAASASVAAPVVAPVAARCAGALPPSSPHPAIAIPATASAAAHRFPFAMNVLFQVVPPASPDPRLVNRLGAVALVVDDAVRARIAEAAPVPGGDV